MHMDIIPMHISHIIMVAKTLRFMSAFLLLRFLRRCSVRDGGIITPSAANVNPLFTFLRFPQKTLQDRYAISSKFPPSKKVIATLRVQSFLLTGGARGGKARLESDQMPR